MTESYCTIFDSLYLSRGLLMYESLKEHSCNFHLYIFAFDDLCYNILFRMNLPDVTVIHQREIENERLLSVKGTRTRGEYCWTCTSSAIDFVLKKYNPPVCTYLDADLFFYFSPSVLHEELQGDKSVLITEHRYAGLVGPFLQKRAGRFCVQFISFKNEPDSLKVLHRWMDQCINWCYSRYEDGKFGDQKYLDDWPVKYQNVHIMNHQGGGVAPWNVQKYLFRREDHLIIGRRKLSREEFKIVFYHFHYVRFLVNGYADLGWNWIPKKVLNIFYIPYIMKILEKEDYLENNFHDYRRNYSINELHGLKGKIKKMLKTIFNYNLVKIPAN